MSEAGYNRTRIQCHKKIKKLKVDYQKIEDKNKQTGNNQKDTKFFNPMNEILSTKPTTQPPILIDSSTNCPADMSTILDNDEKQPPILIDSSTNCPADVSTILDNDEGDHESLFDDNNTEDNSVSTAIQIAKKIHLMQM